MIFSHDERRIHGDSYSEMVRESYSFRQPLSEGKTGYCLSACQSLVSLYLFPKLPGKAGGSSLSH